MARLLNLQNALKMGEIKIFENAQFGQVRTTISASNEPLFCLSDVCKVLELQASAVCRRIQDEVISSHPIIDSIGRTQQANFVNEDGLYDVILDSRKPEAKAFRKWVTSEVLPAIRKTGGYMVAKEDESAEELMARALQVANDTLRRKEERLRSLEAKSEQQAEVIQLQSKELKEQAPKVAYHDEVLTSDSNYTTTQVAKEFGMGAPTLNKILHEQKVQYKLNDQWLLYHQHQNKGYTSTITRSFTGASGAVHTSQLTVWTEKGRKFIHELMSDLGY